MSLVTSLLFTVAAVAMLVLFVNTERWLRRRPRDVRAGVRSTARPGDYAVLVLVAGVPAFLSAASVTAAVRAWSADPDPGSFSANSSGGLLLGALAYAGLRLAALHWPLHREHAGPRDGGR